MFRKLFGRKGALRNRFLGFVASAAAGKAFVMLMTVVVDVDSVVAVTVAAAAADFASNGDAR
jgi:hypothetical protein